MSVSPLIVSIDAYITLVGAAAASTLVVGSHMLVQLEEACCMHSWVVRRSGVEEQAGWGLRRLRAQEICRLLLA